MVSIHHTPQGWNLVLSQNLGYYNSLGDVMVAAYEAINGARDNDALPAGRDQTCHHS